MSNRGIVVGSVFKPNGKAARGASVFIKRITGPSGLLFIDKQIETNSNLLGDFILPFVWSGADFADDLSIIEITLGAYTEDSYSYKEGGSKITSSDVTAKSIVNIRGVLKRDVEGLVKIVSTSNPADGLGDAADFYIEIASAIKKWESLVPFWKTSQMWTTENWIILGGTNIYLR